MKDQNQDLDQTGNEGADESAKTPEVKAPGKNKGKDKDAEPKYGKRYGSFRLNDKVQFELTKDLSKTSRKGTKKTLHRLHAERLSDHGFGKIV